MAQARRQDSAQTRRRGDESDDGRASRSNYSQPRTSFGMNAANESKDAITGRIIHTVNMMKEVLQGNLGLRETIQKQSELIDDQNAEIFQLQNENEDLRERLAVQDEFKGKEHLIDLQQLV